MRLLTAILPMLLATLVLTSCGASTKFDGGTAIVPENVDPPQSNDPNSPTLEPNSVLVSWQIPDERENGEDLPMSDIGGYELMYRRVGELAYTAITLTNQNLSQHLVTDLIPGQYEFLIAAFDSEGLYSDFSEPTYITVGSS